MGARDVLRDMYEQEAREYKQRQKYYDFEALRQQNEKLFEIIGNLQDMLERQQTTLKLLLEALKRT